jgi:hypothetical protein
MTGFARIVATYDYLTGAWLIVLPWVFGFTHFFIPAIVSMMIGSGIIVYSLLTNYRFGWIRLIPSQMHDLVDMLTGFLLCLAPWLFDYEEIVLWPHFLTGLFYLTIIFFTRSRKRRRLLTKHLTK